MRTLALCLFALACSVSATEEWEELVVPDTQGSVVKRSLDDDFEKMLEQLEKKYVPESKKEETKWVAKGQNDIYTERRWSPVKSLHSSVRDQDRMTSVTAAQKQQLLDLHNSRRRLEGSSNMEKLRYNDELASRAQQWCQNCVFKHGQPDGKTDIGQNMYGNNSHEYDKFLETAMDHWYNEKPLYDYNAADCSGGSMCGHYTQVTWGKTNEVGCGLCFCPSLGGNPDSHFIVCNYLPAGNFFKEQKNNLKGTPCTQCSSGKFFCDDGLCNSECSSPGANCECKAACKQCGEQDNNACTCKCRDGTTGPDCSEECRDLNVDECNSYRPMPSICDMAGWEFVKPKCPKLCGMCKGPSSDTPPCNKKDEGKSLKRLLLDFLKKEEKEGKLEKKK